MRHYPASNLTPGHPNSLQQVKPKGAADWTSIINDEICYCRDGGVMRVYQFDAASTATQALPDVVIPDGNATGTGRWLQITFYTAPSGGAVDFIEQDTIGGDLYTQRRFEDPFSVVQGTGVGGHGFIGLPSWEADVLKDQTFDSFVFHGGIVFLNSSGDWQRARADDWSNMGGAWFGMALGTSGAALTTGQVLIKGTINHAYIGTFLSDVGQKLYLSNAAWGQMTMTLPTEDFLVQVGWKIDTRAMFFDPMKTVIELPPSGGGG